MSRSDHCEICGAHEEFHYQPHSFEPQADVCELTREQEDRLVRRVVEELRKLYEGDARRS